MSLSLQEKEELVLLEDRARRKHVRSSLAAWSRLNGYEPAPHHELLIQCLESAARERNSKFIFCLPRGAAKALALDTPIPVPTGWTKMGELQEGDEVFDENGKICRVTHVSPIWRNRPCFAVKTECGDSIIADADHQWLVSLDGGREDYKLRPTTAIARHRNNRAKIVRNKALDLPEQSLPLDPYVLGVWLGDGHKCGGRLTCGDQDKEWFVSEFARLGLTLVQHAHKTNFGIPNIRRALVYFSLLSDHLEEGHKHIPAMYLRASYQQRLSLLQGLVDTDGTVDARQGRGMVTFCNTNKILAQDVQELVRSLGVKCTLNENRAMLYGKDCGPVYRLCFFHKEAARMPRKRALCRNAVRTLGAYVEATPVPNQDTVCITVDSPSHLFLCGRSMLPTHNSTYGSKLFPPWALADRGAGGWQPRSILAASHNKDLIQSFGRDCRNRIDRFPKELGYALRRDSKAADEWATTNGKEYFCAGVGAGIAGHRGDLGIVDDYFGSVEDADSDLNRDRVWDWFWADFIGCLNPGASIVVIATRWHEADLVGRLLKQERHLWNLISIPLIAKDNDPLGRAKGERLWPAHYDDEKERQARVEPRIFSAVWQQEPSPEDGDYFRVEALERCAYKELGDLPKDLRAHVGSDHAISKREEADKTCMVSVGVDTKGVLWVLPNIIWGRYDADEQVDKMFDLAKWLDGRYGSTWWVAEKEKITQCLGPYLFKKMRDEGHFFVIDQVTPKKDKRWRARSLQALVNAGQVRFPTFAPWWPDARRELLAFDNLGEDDFVDALAHVARKINSVQPAEEVRDLPEFLSKDPPPERGIRITMREIREQMERKARETRVSAM